MKRTVISGAVLALAIAGTGTGSAGQTQYKVTGGGQTLVGSSGAGNTIAFNARGGSGAGNADGQLQFVDRSAGTGQDQVVRHGHVDCVAVHSFEEDGGHATVGGVFRDTGERFTLDVIDNGEGAAAENDIIEFRDSQSPECADRSETDDEPAIELARGNVQVHKEKAPR